MLTVSAIARAMLADSERKPAWLASATSNHTREHWANGDNAESVSDTTATPCSERAFAWATVSLA